MEMEKKVPPPALHNSTNQQPQQMSTDGNNTAGTAGLVKTKKDTLSEVGRQKNFCLTLGKNEY